MNRIFILLPHKEKFSKKNSGSASIWVKDFYNLSVFKNEISVYGSNVIKKNATIKRIYNNIDIKNIKYQSKTSLYLKKFLNSVKKKNPQIIEIHNRPNYLTTLFTVFSKINYILIIHNDPLHLKGSQSIDERKNLLKICAKIYFVSKWVEEKFFQGIEKNFYNNFNVMYPSINALKKMPKKENIIVFAGKLNRSKGFPIFAEAIINILKKYKKWSALVIGDEPREKYSYKHKRITYLGWIPYEEVLKKYSKSSITVAPSQWEEPFGRSSMEAGSRGNVVIISNKGGLPETINSPILLKKITSSCIYEEIEKLILNKKNLLRLQNDSFKNPLHLISENCKLLDKDRINILNPTKKIFLNTKAKIKILHIYNKAERMGSRIYFISTGKKIENGLIRLGHDVEGLSDRDILSYNSNIVNFKNTSLLNELILKKTYYYNPDLILIGHVNTITNDTFSSIKKYNKNIVISQWYEDNIAPSGPDYFKNTRNLSTNFNNIDNFFISTHPDDIDKKNKNINYHFLPTPADRNIEKLNIYNNKFFTHDVFFAMSHGVNRGNLKSGKIDERDQVINKLI
jgi:glycosyltransferase involved in cell wall biosynthesis